MRKVLLAVLLMTLCISLSAEGMEILRADIQATVQDDGSVLISEDLAINYLIPSHGFIRSIPLNGGHVKVLSVSEDYQLSSNSAVNSIRIGNEDELVSGIVEYSILYEYDPGRDTNSGYDEYYMDIFTAYDDPVLNLSFSVAFPRDIDPSKVWVTAGYYGSTSSPEAYVIENRYVSGVLDRLSPGQSLTVRVELPDGYFIRKDYSVLAAVAAALLSLAFVGAYTFFYLKYGRDEDPVIVPTFSPPEGLSPLDVGYLYDSSDDGKDYSAMLYWWADRGFMTIEEKGKDSFILHKVKDLEGGEDYERNLFAALFKKGDDADLERINISGDIEHNVRPLLKKKYSKGEKNLYDEKAMKFHYGMTAGVIVYVMLMALCTALNDLEFGFFSFVTLLFQFLFVYLLFWSLGRKLPTVKQYVFTYIIAAFISILAIVMMQGICLSAGISAALTRVIAVFVCVGVCALAALSAFTTKRSAYAQKVIGEILGYRDFLEKVEVDKLKELINEDPDYFYHNLSYAIVLGLEKEWAKKAEAAFSRPATWYYTTNPVGNYFFYAYVFNRLNRRCTAAFTPPVRSNSGTRAGGFSGSHSGFSGFAGGGRGGGGASRW